MYATAPAAIDDATPTSFWHPPAAPEMFADSATIEPMPPATTSPRTVVSGSMLRSSSSASSVPGTIPPAPAVGAATMTPMREFSPITDSAYSSALTVSGSRNVLPLMNASLSLRASSPTSLPIDCPPLLPRSTQSRMTARRLLSASMMSSRGTAWSCSSCSRKTSARSRPWAISSSCLNDSITGFCPSTVLVQHRRSSRSSAAPPATAASPRQSA